MKNLLKVLLILFVFFAVSSTIAEILPKVDGGDKIVVIPIEGMISFDSDYTGVDAEKVMQYLDVAEEEETVKGIILEINSGGGAVVASKQIMEKVKDSEKPVVSVIKEVGASGAYWIASGSDAVVADELSITGSVGVLGSYLQFSGLLNDYNVSYERLVGGELKDLRNPFKEPSDYEREVMQKKIEMIHDYFLSSVKENRNLTSLSGIRTGVYYLGGEAEKLNLVDYLGDKNLAVNITNELAGTKDARIVKFETKKPWYYMLDKLAYDFGFNLNQGIKDNLIETDANFLA